MPKKIKNISIMGDGGWGTTLALLLAEKGFSVTLWGAFPKYISEMGKTRENRKFLPGIKFPPSIILTSDVETAVSQSDIIVLAVPSQYLSDVLKKIKKSDYQKKHFVSVIKGIELTSFMTMSQLIQKELGKVPIAVLSGPTIAIEVARKIPTTAVVASQDQKLAQEIQGIFSCDYFRVYTNTV
ncbi:MAG: NAD(P)-binding domain-containing protein, partial [Candidatus Omnitrophica bacterium]|nr:NAD(P)-binding domain-containing protein [Candidatus Omnitrophota bacterium]